MAVDKILEDFGLSAVVNGTAFSIYAIKQTIMNAEINWWLHAFGGMVFTVAGGLLLHYLKDKLSEWRKRRRAK